MKQAWKSIKSGTVFYIEQQNDIDVTLRNPISGEVKTIKPSTLKRSYQKISEEELKMTQVENFEVAEKFGKLMECEERGEFVTALEADINAFDADTEFADILACEDSAVVKKALGNANLCFRENMTRFKSRRQALKEVMALQEQHPEDLDIAKEVNAIKVGLNTSFDKMIYYSAKLNAANIRLKDLAPVAEETTEAE